jgi:hypothetical protein
VAIDLLGVCCEIIWRDRVAPVPQVHVRGELPLLIRFIELVKRPDEGGMKRLPMIDRGGAGPNRLPAHVVGL